MISFDHLKQIGDQYGTPIYVYDSEKIKEQVQKLQNAFSQVNHKIFYACKALTNINIVHYIHQLGCGIDCSSINEVKLAIHAGVNNDHILYTSNGIAFEEIKEAAQLGVHINIDSISNLKKFAHQFTNNYPIGIRIRPNILAGGNLKISTGHEKSKFGIPIEQLEEVQKIVADTGLIIKTIHLHTGSDIKDAEVFLQGLKVVADMIHLFPHVTVLDLGGGFKVPYEPNHDETDVQLIAQKLQQFLVQNNYFQIQNLELWFEPGKYIVSECGYFITSVNVIKQNSNSIIAGVNSGLNHLIRPMFYDAYHHIVNISNLTGEEKIYTVTGNICETDTFATDRKLNEIREGDYLVFYNAGAYCFEMASHYNSRFKPAELLIINEKPVLIRKPDTFEDLVKNQIIAPYS